ncbi:formin 1, putative [Babesia caballi]|uniref:Formin 1, putative n=1 Tax=Babesia caballi TaxID=5871 RepID=A0AAV4LYS1_BABCB|nr:formin 1, putative [Babesia caballi]
MEYVDHESLTEAEIGAMDNVTVRSKVSELPMGSSSNISPYALGMSVRIDLEKRRRATQTDKERNMMAGNAFMDSRGKLGASDKVVEAASILRKLESNCGAVVYREALATRMQLRKMALKNFSAQNFSDALLQAHYSLLLAKKFHMEISKTPLSGEMAMELLILSKCYAQVGRLEAGRTHLLELRFLVEQTLLHFANPSATTPSPARSAVINCDAKVFPSIVFSLGEILTMYDQHEDAEKFFAKYLVLFEREFGEESLQLSDAINSVCIYLLRTRQYTKALPLAAKALGIQKKHFGDYTSETPDARVAEGYCNVGVIYRMIGNPVDALHHFLIAIDMKMRILQDRTHPQVQDVFLSIGCCQHMLGNFHAAASIYREVYITRCESLGATHPLTISVKHLLEDLDRDIKLAPRSAAADQPARPASADSDALRARVEALGAEKGHSTREHQRGAPGIEMSRIQALYASKTKHFLMPVASIMQTQDCLVPRKQVLELSRQISLQYASQRLPILNVPRMARGRLFLNDSQPVMECNQDAVDLLLEWDFRPPTVTSEGDVEGSDPKLPSDVRLFIPIFEDGEVLMGFHNKPIFVPNPGIFHAYKRSKVTYNFNLGAAASVEGRITISDVPSARGLSDASRAGSAREVDPKTVVRMSVSTTAQPPPRRTTTGSLPGSQTSARQHSVQGTVDPAGGSASAAPGASGAPDPPVSGSPPGVTSKTTTKTAPKVPSKSVVKSPAPKEGGEPVMTEGVAPSPDAPKQDSSQDPSQDSAKPEEPAPAPAPEAEPEPVSLIELMMKKAAGGPNSRNAKFLAKIGRLGKIVVKANQIKPVIPVKPPMAKTTAPAVHAAPPSSDTESEGFDANLSDAATTLSDLEEEELPAVTFTVQNDPVAMATMVDASPRVGHLPLDLRSIHDPLPMDVLNRVRGIRSHKEEDKPVRCMLIDSEGASLALVPWQIDMISLTLAKSCLSLELMEKYGSGGAAEEDSSEPSKEAQIEAYRKLLAGEGLHNFGFASLIAGAASQSLASASGSLASGLGMDLPPSVLANLRKQAEEMERKAKEEAERAAAEKEGGGGAGDGDGPGGGMPKVVPILKKATPEAKKAPPALKKGAPKGLAPPSLKKGLPTKTKGRGQASLVDNSRVRRFFWDPIFGDDAKGTLFACPKGLPNVEKPEIEETFAKAAPKARVAIVAKPKVLNLLPDSKRAYNMNIGLSKFSKYTFQELKDAVMGLDPSVLNIEATEGLMTLLPTAEEINIVQEYVKSGGDMNAVDRPEQFVAVIATIPLLKQRLESHHVALTFKEHFQEIVTPLERIMDGCEAVMASTRLNVLSNVILKIGNTLNEGDSKKGNAEGFKPTTFAKLNEFRTTAKPVKTLMQYICDLVAREDETVLEIYNELRVCEDCSKIDMAALEGNIAKFKNDMQRVTNAIAAAERLKDPGDEFVPVMRDFMKDAEPKVAFVQDQHKDVMVLFRETVKYMGYPDKEVDKVRVDELFRHIWGFAKSVEVARKTRLEAIEKEHRMRLAETRKREQAARKSKMRTSLVPTNITATPKMVDEMKNIVKTQS